MNFIETEIVIVPAEEFEQPYSSPMTFDISEVAYFYKSSYKDAEVTFLTLKGGDSFFVDRKYEVFKKQLRNS